MKKSFLLLYIVLLLSSSLFSMGSRASNTVHQPYTLSMSWWGGESRHIPTLEALAVFQEQRPDLIVEGQYGLWDGYYQKLVTQMAGDITADVVQIDQPWLYEFCTQGTTYVEIAEENFNLTGFDTRFLNEYCSFEGKLMGLPTGLNVNTFLVDTALLDKSGIDVDTQWTWDNIITEGRKVHQHDSSSYFTAATPDLLLYWFEMYLAQIAGEIVTADRQIAFTREQGIEAFCYFQRWFDEGIIAPFSQSSFFYQKFSEDPAWIQGKIASSWDWVSSMEVDIGSRQYIESRPFPVHQGARNSGVLVRPSQILVVAASSSQQQAAWDLLTFLFHDEQALTLLGTSSGIPATSHARNLLTEQGLISQRQARALEQGLTQAGLPQSKWQMNSQVRQVMQDVIDEFGFGKLSPVEAEAKLRQSLEEMLTNA